MGQNRLRHNSVVSQKRVIGVLKFGSSKVLKLEAIACTEPHSPQSQRKLTVQHKKSANRRYADATAWYAVPASRSDGVMERARETANGREWTRMDGVL